MLPVDVAASLVLQVDVAGDVAPAKRLQQRQDGAAVPSTCHVTSACHTTDVFLCLGTRPTSVRSLLPTNFVREQKPSTRTRPLNGHWLSDTHDRG